MSIVLSRRLACIAGRIVPGSRVIDVGTDHGYIPAWLAENGISPGIIASDIRVEPLKRAENTAKHAGVYDSIRFRLCAGLEGCEPDSVDTIIIAGMGGETIAGILEAAPWAREKQLLLQPQSKIPELRTWLYGAGYAIRDAELVSDAGRIYLVWSVTGGYMAAPGVIDHQLVEKRDPLLPAWLDSEIKKKLKICRGLESSAAVRAEELGVCRQELNELLKLREETEAWPR